MADSRAISITAHAGNIADWTRPAVARYTAPCVHSSSSATAAAHNRETHPEELEVGVNYPTICQLHFSEVWDGIT